MYWLVQLPDGQYRQVQAASGEQALTIVRSLYGGQYGATDLSSIQLASPTGASRPFDVATAPPANFRAQDVGANTGPTQTQPPTTRPPVNTGPTAGSTDRNQQAPITAGPGTPQRGQPFTEPPPQLRQGGGVTDTSGNPIYISEESPEGRFGSFQRALGATGRNIAGVFGEPFRDQFDPYQQAFNARTALGQFPAEGAGENAFGNFVQGNQNPYRLALDSLRQLYASRQQGPVTAPVGSYLTPTTDQDFSSARGLFDAALQGRVGGAASQFLRRFIPQAQSQFYAGNNPDFLGELQRRLGLGNALF